MKVAITPNSGMHPHHARQILDRCGVNLVYEKDGQLICDMNEQQRTLWRDFGFMHRLDECDPKPEAPAQITDVDRVNSLEQRVAQLEQIADMVRVMFPQLESGDEEEDVHRIA